MLNANDSRALTYDLSWNLLSERTFDGRQIGEYIFGSRTDEILSAQLGSKTYYPLTDGLGFTLALTDKNGKVAERYRTMAYGMPTVLKANYQPQTASATTGYRFLFTGREWLSQVGLNDHRYRYYCPSLGRWLTTVPIRFGASDVNLYRYVWNSPISFLDSDGLDVTTIDVSNGLWSGYTYSITYSCYDTPSVLSVSSYGTNNASAVIISIEQHAVGNITGASLQDLGCCTGGQGKLKRWNFTLNWSISEKVTLGASIVWNGITIGIGVPFGSSKTGSESGFTDSFCCN